MVISLKLYPFAFSGVSIFKRIKPIQKSQPSISERNQDIWVRAIYDEDYSRDDSEHIVRKGRLHKAVFAKYIEFFLRKPCLKLIYKSFHIFLLL